MTLPDALKRLNADISDGIRLIYKVSAIWYKSVPFSRSALVFLYNLGDSKYVSRGKIVESIAFPKMFGVGRTNTVSDREATIQNLKLLLTSEKRELFCDPYFGDNLKRMLYEKNNSALKDILIDDIHVAIATFMP